jgi:hypothetical protein
LETEEVEIQTWGSERGYSDLEEKKLDNSAEYSEHSAEHMGQAHLLRLKETEMTLRPWEVGKCVQKQEMKCK